MGGPEVSPIPMIVIIAVIVAVAAWLIYFIYRIRKTKRFYQEMIKNREERDRDRPEHPTGENNHSAEKQEKTEGNIEK